MNATLRLLSMGFALSLALHAAWWAIDRGLTQSAGEDPQPPAPVAFLPQPPTPLDEQPAASEPPPADDDAPLDEPETLPAPAPEAEAPSEAVPTEEPPAAEPPAEPPPAEPPPAEPEAAADPPASPDREPAAPAASEHDEAAASAAPAAGTAGGDPDAVPLRIRWKDRRELAAVSNALDLAIVAVRNAAHGTPELVAELTFRADATPEVTAPRESYASFSNRVRELPASFFRGIDLPDHDRVLAFVPRRVDAAWSRQLTRALAARGDDTPLPRAAVAAFVPVESGFRLVVERLLGAGF